MWFDIDLCGIKFQLNIKGYQDSTKGGWDEQWCDVDFAFISPNWLNYHKENDEVLLSCEIEELAQSLDDLLQDRLTEIKTIECIEPDFNFILTPKRDLRNDPRYTYVREGCEIADIYMEMKVFFWNDGLTDNYLSITFNRTDIEYLKQYLLLTMKKTDSSTPAISEMIEKGILKKQYA